MRVKVNRESANQDKNGADYRSFHMVRFGQRSTQKTTEWGLRNLPFLIANMGSMPDKCAARL